MANREYQKLATRQGIRSFLGQNWRGISAGEPEFYRPVRRPDPRRFKNHKKVIARPEQLSFDFVESYDPASPLKDVFPEFYE
jgi:hypothetical protein